MRAFIKNHIEAVKARREENGEGGFSLIELIVVIVILGILLAIAIPVFLGLQGQANQRALETITANAASQAAAAMAQDGPIVVADIQADFDNFLGESNAPDGLNLTLVADAGEELDSFCVTGTATGLDPAYSGPGCSS
ncbi:type II secretion system protein [Microbacterium sp. 2FI]|uniref:type II secretion system protein n=1 Tax=Microbacterium sp. 2FI TaxID=2502193 RepID=UPI0010F6A640|nr:type II secretion system protein [Microbacterium sp. 2FI]